MRWRAVSSRLFSALALAVGLAPGLSLAEPPGDGIRVDGPLSDADLYRLATCGAPPGGQCQRAALRWQKPVLTLRVAPGPDTIQPGLTRAMTDAALRAIDQVNGTGAGITLIHAVTSRADITLRPTDLPEGTQMPDRPGFSGPGIMGVGYMTVWPDDNDTIQEAVILISTTIDPAIMDSVVLEEVTQSLGLLYDIDGPAYDGISILAQDSNATTTLTGQDAALLRLHYPAP